VKSSLEGVLDPFAAAGAIPGVVALVADESGILAEAAVGHADIAQGRPMRMDTLFWVASQTKPVTAALLMMLVDEAKVRLDDPVAEYLPEFGKLWVRAEEDEDHVLLRRPERPVTVRDLLCHMSGLPFLSAMEEPTIDLLTLPQAVRSYVMTPLASQPGQQYLYSNMGINTIGRVLEVVSGTPYESFVTERLLRPLGMDDTAFRPSPEQLVRLATTYRPSPDGSAYEATDISFLFYPLDSPERQAVPAGGLFSTAPDMLKFLRMILGRGVYGGTRLLSESAVAQMAQRQTPAGAEANYGLGWSLGADSFGHGGACGTDMKVYPDAGVAALYMIQHQGLTEPGGGCFPAFEAAVRDLSARRAGAE